MVTGKSTFSVIFIAQKGKPNKRTGKAPIIGRITIDREFVHFSTRQLIEGDRWTTEDGGRTVGRTVEEKHINSVLKDLRTAIENKYNQLIILGEPITAAILKALVFKVKPEKPKEEVKPELESVMLVEHFQRFNDTYKALIGKETTHKSWTRYELTLKKLRMFMQEKYGIENIPLHEITTQFIKDYFTWLRTTEDNSHNYHMKTVQRFGTVFREAIDNGWVNRDPFKNFKMTYEETDRGYLTMDEIGKIMKKRMPSDRLEKVRDIFILSCYTGLAYCDVQKLKKSEVVREVDGSMWIKTKRGKTGTKVHVKLLNVPLQIIEKYADPTDSERLLVIPSNQKVNDYLKEIAGICGIEKRITFHLARHTFATTVTLTNGVPLETVSKMLGHKNIRTTMIYARVLNDKTSNDMTALEQRLDTKRPRSTAQ